MDVDWLFQNHLVLLVARVAQGSGKNQTRQRRTVFMRCILSIILLLVILPIAFGYQDPPKGEFEFKKGQSAYVVAIKSNGNPDLAVEQKLKKEFKNKKTFNLASSLSSADFVFVMYVEYEYNQVAVSGIGIGSEDIRSASAYVVLPAIYSQFKSDLDNLRDEALWQFGKNNNMWRTGGLPVNIVKKFHKMAVRK
jgi:hypothetical protein